MGTQFKYIFYSVLSVCIVFVLFLVYRLFSSPKDPVPTFPIEVQKTLQEKVNRAEEDALIAKTKATLQAEEAEKALNEIMVIDDGVERRKRLADLLNGE